MLRKAIALFMLLLASGNALTQTMTLATSSSDYQITNVFSDVDFFDIEIVIDTPLAPGLYVDPPLVSVTYQVTGTLEPGTPSGFTAFDLQRDISGADFYAQGSSLSFEIAQSAVLDDGVQVAELVGNGVVLTFNAREVDNGRFHPTLLELDIAGTGRMQNSNNVPSLNPLVEVDFGEEYINDLVFDAGNTTWYVGSLGPLPLNRIAPASLRNSISSMCASKSSGHFSATKARYADSLQRSAYREPWHVSLWPDEEGRPLRHQAAFL